MRRLVAIWLLGFAFSAATCGAAGKSASGYWQDTRDYFTAPARWDSSDWATAGGVVLGIAAAYSVDRPIRNQFHPAGTATANSGGTRDALPLAAIIAGTFAAGLAGGDKELIDTGFDMGEAIALSTVSVHLLKPAFGRLRPRQSSAKDQFGKRGSSFPSGHTTAVFAAAQVLADELPPEQWGWRIVAYGLAAATGYARMDSNAHWFSDTVAGAALGVAGGRFVSNRRSGVSSRVSFAVKPVSHGAMVVFAIDTH